MCACQTFYVEFLNIFLNLVDNKMSPLVCIQKHKSWKMINRNEMKWMKNVVHSEGYIWTY